MVPFKMLAISALLISACLVFQPGRAAVALQFRDVSAPKRFVTVPREKFWGATIVDLDRDGRYDLLLCNHKDPFELYWSTGRSGFRYMDPGLRTDLHSFAADDLNGDGNLDLVLVRGGQNGNNPKAPFVWEMPGGRSLPSSKDGVGTKFGLGNVGLRGRSVAFLDLDADADNDLLYVSTPNLNDTVWAYVYERTETDLFKLQKKTGLEDFGAKTFGIVDYNQDGYMDLIAMRPSSVELYINTSPSTGGISFRRSPHAIAKKANMKAPRGLAEIDCDNDGVFELMIVSGRARRNGKPDDFSLKLGRDGVYRDMGIKLPARDNHYGVTHGDFDNDGLMDLYIARTGTREGTRLQDRLFRNTGNCNFVEDTPSSLFSKVKTELGESVKAFDYDLDGRIDILSGSKQGTWRLYRNETPQGKRRYLIVRVGHSKRNNRHPMGATVKVFCKRRVFLQRVGSSGQSHTQSFTDTLHFGLGFCPSVDKVEVMYAGGLVEKVAGRIPVNSVVTVGRFDAKCPPGVKCIVL